MWIGRLPLDEQLAVLPTVLGVNPAFGLVLRPNPRQAPRHVYEAKVARWTEEWPELTALPWP
ncbi:nucleotidyltransferase family protein [Nonomuraea sp. NPDC052116]|uniref:nucleotidyltransferase family protein n=1 Tax=Nonomuraea sp. NPDC052116 TaxID=3155665 RepID=UPI003423DDB4